MAGVGRSPWGVVLVVLAAVTLSPGCSKKTSKKQARSPLVSPKNVHLAPKNRPIRSKHRVSVKRDMQKIFKITQEIRRRAQGTMDMTGPSKMMLKVSAKLPVKSYPSSFRGFLDAMDDQLKQLPSAKDHRRDYHGLVDTCVACHRYYAPRTADAMRMLRLAGGDTAPKTPPPKKGWVEP